MNYQRRLVESWKGPLHDRLFPDPVTLSSTISGRGATGSAINHDATIIRHVSLCTAIYNVLPTKGVAFMMNVVDLTLSGFTVAQTSRDRRNPPIGILTLRLGFEFVHRVRESQRERTINAAARGEPFRSLLTSESSSPGRDIAAKLTPAARFRANGHHASSLRETQPSVRILLKG